MKITKRQLRRIIREEKANLLTEMSPFRDADRSLSIYANVTTSDQVTNGILALLREVDQGAIEDGMEDDEAEEMARNATLLAVSQAFESAGLMDVKMALQKLIR